MKKITEYLLILIILLLISSFLYSRVVPLEPFSLGKTNGVISNHYNNKNYPVMLNLRYNQKINEKKRITEFIEIYFNDYLNRTCITIKTRDRKKFLKLLDKVSDNIKSEKEKINVNIGELNIGISWKTGNKEWIETENNKMSIEVKTSIDKSHEMVVSFSEATLENEKYKPGILYLKEENINELKKILSNDNYNSLLKNAKQI